MPEELNFLQPKFTFSKLDIKLLFIHSVQHCSQMLLMLLHSLRIDQNVINKHDDKVSHKVLKDTIHGIHEY